MSDSLPILYRYDVALRMGVSAANLPANLLAEIGEAIDDAIADWGEELFDAWPRDTGRSFASWDSFREGLVVTLRNVTPYAGYVHPEGGSTGDSWDHMRAHWERLGAQIVARFSDRARVAAAQRSVRAVTIGGVQAQQPQRAGVIDFFRAATSIFSTASVRERNRTRPRERLRLR